MSTSIKKIELTAPAGGWGQLVAAINAGADSIYLGYRKFGARAYAENFDLKQLKRAIKFAHKNNVKIYLTLNTLIKDSEIEEVIFFLKDYTQICTDGVIITDFGVYKLIKDLFPFLPVHASTQLSIHNIYSLKLLKELKFKRAILARELTLNEIKDIDRKRFLEIEIFGHGSQCYCYSGNCYFSSFIGGRSGNRGRCTQPCRMKYKILKKDSNGFHYITEKSNFLLSKNDLCTLEIIPKIINTGINALKIEGRMKSAEYVGIVVKTYRKYIDMYYENPENFRVEKEDLYKITQIFSRELGTGYFKNKYPKEIISIKRSGSIGNFLGRIIKINYDDQSFCIKSKWYINKGDIIEVWTNRGNEHIKINSFQMIDKVNENTIYKIAVNKKINIALNDRVFKFFDSQLDAEAKSLFKNNYHKGSNNKALLYSNMVMEGNKINKSKNENIFIKDKSALEKYLNRYGFRDGKNQDERGIGAVSCDYVPNNKLDGLDFKLSAIVYNEDQLRSAVSGGAFYIIYDNFNEFIDKKLFSKRKFKKLGDYCRNCGAELVINIPPVLYDDNINKFKENFYSLVNSGVKSFFISNIGVLQLLNYENSLKKIDLNIFLSFYFNIFNSLALNFFREFSGKHESIKGVALSSELNLNEIAEIIHRAKKTFNSKMDFFVYGHGKFPILNSRYKAEYVIDDYNKRNKYYLEDIKGYKFQIDSDYSGSILISNSKNMCTFFELDRIICSGLSSVIIDSRFFNNTDLLKIIRSYKKAVSLFLDKGMKEYEGYINYFKDNLLFKNYTKGHLLRGVQ